MRRLAWMSLAGLMWASTAFATSTPAERKQAQKIAAEATRAFKAGDFEHAAKLVRDAYALDPAPTLLYNLARALEAADDEEGAVEAYERYLREDPDSENRGAVEQRIETLKAKLREEAVAQQPATPAPTPKPTPPPPRDTGAASSPGVVPFVLMGAGGAGLVAGSVLGLMANSAKSRAEDPATSGVDTLDERDRARSLGTYSTVGFVAGGVLLASGVTWWMLSPSEKQAVGVRLSPTRVSIVSSF